MRHRDYSDIDDKKKTFLNELMKSRGIKSIAYTKTGIGKTTFYEWQRKDSAFSSAIKEIEERWLDVVESKLLDLILLENVAATIFYLKTKGKDRGYSQERIQATDN